MRRGIARGRRADADIGAPHPPVPGDLAGDEMRGVGSDRKADALRAHDDRGVDADHLARRGDQRAAGIARIERGVGLHDVLDHPAGAERSERPSAETTPAVTVASKPSGLPMAMAIWPRLSLALSPSCAAGSVTPASTRSSARSRVGIVAEHARLELAAFERGETDRRARPGRHGCW